MYVYFLEDILISIFLISKYNLMLTYKKTNVIKSFNYQNKQNIVNKLIKILAFIKNQC